MSIDTKKWGAKLLWSLVSLVVIAGGVFIGIYGAVKSGLAEQLSFGELPPEIGNITEFTLGEPFPSMFIEDSTGRVRALPDMTRGVETIIAFVENGCDPCHRLIDYCREEAFYFDDRQLLFLSMDDSSLYHEQVPNLFKFEETYRDRFSIDATPTVIGLDKSGRIAFVVCGYDPVFNREYFDLYL